MNKKIKKLNAFTLAEVLITLGIIGVVAAMTMPTLITKYKEKTTVAKLKETYSMLNQAFKMAQVKNGDPQYWYGGGNDMGSAEQHAAFAENLAPYLKTTEKCINTSYEYNKEHCTTFGKTPSTASYIRLVNGVTILIRVWNANCSLSYADLSRNDTCGELHVFLRPFATSFKSGIDEFAFYITRRGIYPYGTPNSPIKFERACNKSITAPYPDFSGSSNMYACAAWVIHNENLDYLHCDDLSWTGKHRCKD